MSLDLTVTMWTTSHKLLPSWDSWPIKWEIEGNNLNVTKFTLFFPQEAQNRKCLLVFKLKEQGRRIYGERNNRDHRNTKTDMQNCQYTLKLKTEGKEKVDRTLWEF